MVSLLLDEKLFIASRMVDLLSWYKILWETVYPCASVKCLPYMMEGITSSIPISLHSI